MKKILFFVVFSFLCAKESGSKKRMRKINALHKLREIFARSGEAYCECCNDLIFCIEMVRRYSKDRVVWYRSNNGIRAFF